MDIIFIDNLKVYGILGIHEREQRNPQLIQISLRAEVDIQNAAVNDDIRQTVNYSTLAIKVMRFISENRFLTIEALIETLAMTILENKRITSLWLRVEKPHAVPDAQSVGVEINRSNSN